MTDIADETDESTALGPLNEDDNFVKEILCNIKEARMHRSKWRTDAREDYDFFAGRQWSDEDRQKLEDEERPPVVFNRVMRTINAIVGLELTNRHMVRFIPYETRESGFNEMLTQAAEWVRDQCDAEDEESEAFKDCGICGEGWTETRMDYEDDPEGMIIIDRIDPLYIVPDHRSVKRNYTDARFVFHVREMTKSEVEELIPDVNLDDIEPGEFFHDAEASPHDADDAFKYENDQSDKLSKSKTYSIIHYQYWKRETVYRVVDVNGKIIELDLNKFNKLKKIIERAGLKYVRAPKRKYYRLFLSGDKVLMKDELSCNKFTFNGITGERDRNSNSWFGFVRVMRDPQMWANKWLSQIQHIINTGAKNGLIVEQSAVKNQRKLEESWALPGSLSIVADGAIKDGRIMPKEAPRYPDGVDRLLQYALSAINDVIGVSLEMLGTADRNQPGFLEDMRKQASISLLATFFNSLRNYRKNQGRVLADYISKYIADGRLIEVTGPQGAQHIPLLRDNLAMKYNVKVDEAPTSANMKERTFRYLFDLLPLALQAGIPIPPEVIDYMPLPESLTLKWKEMLANSGQDPLVEQLKMIELMQKQLELQDMQKDLQVKDSTIVLNQAKASQAAATGQDEMAQSMQKMGMANREHEMKEQAMMREQQRKDLAMMLDSKRKMIQLQLDNRLKAQQQTLGQYNN